MKILVIGDVGLDIYKIGKAKRLSPEAPVPVLSDIREEIRLGMAANVAANVKSLGCEPELISVTGADSVFQDLLEEHQIQNRIYLHPKRRMTKKTRIVADNQQIVRLDVEQAEPIWVGFEDLIITAIKRSDCDGIILSDYGKGVLGERVIRAAINTKKKVFVDPHKTTPPTWYDGTYLIKINARDRITGYEAPVIVVTDSANGMRVFNGADADHIPAKAEQVVDVTGAGDTVIAALAVAILSGNSPLEAAQFANKAAAIVVKKFGTSTCSLAEI